MGKMSKRHSQAIVEYFLILVVVAILTIMGITNLMPKIHQAAEDYADDRISKIAGAELRSGG